MSIQIVDKIVIRKVSEIKPYFRNPRSNEKTVKALLKLIPEAGFNVPILLDDNNVIVKGHARYKAAIQLGMEEVPCVYSVADDETNMKDRITDNKTSELSEWIDEELFHELDKLTIDPDTLSLLGLPSVDIDEMIPDMKMDEDGETEEEKRARYQAYLDNHPSEVPKELITTQAGIDSAAIRQQSIPEKPKKYYRICCNKCGNVMYVAEGDAMPLEE